MILATIIFVICGLILYFMYRNSSNLTQEVVKEILITGVIIILVSIMFMILCLGIVELAGLQ